MRGLFNGRPWASRILAVITLALVAAASPAGAQGETKSLVVTFASASATQNGYLHGLVRLQYRFDSCGDRPQLFYALEPGSAQGFEGYWYEGKMYGLKSTWRPAAAPALEADMQVNFDAKPIPVSPLRNPVTGPISCMSGSQYRMLGQWSAYTSPTLTREQALKHFTFNVGTTRAPMRSPDVEAAIRAEIAAANQKARADSVEKARIARVEQARK